MIFHYLYPLHEACHHPHNLFIISNSGLSKDATKISTTVDAIIAIQYYTIVSAWLCYSSLLYILLLLPLEKDSREKKRIQKCPSCVSFLGRKSTDLQLTNSSITNPLKQLNRKTINKNINESEDRDQTNQMLPIHRNKLVKKENH